MPLKSSPPRTKAVKEHSLIAAANAAIVLALSLPVTAALLVATLPCCQHGCTAPGQGLAITCQLAGKLLVGCRSSPAIGCCCQLLPTHTVPSEALQPQLWCNAPQQRATKRGVCTRPPLPTAGRPQWLLLLQSQLHPLQ